MRKNTENRVSLGFSEALALLFIALKLCGVISWSWLWVLSPIWITLGIIGLIGIVIVVLRHIA